MAEPDKDGLVAFDDGPELEKLKGWYDRVREDAAEARPTPETESRKAS